MLMRGVRGNRRDSLKLQTILLFVLLFGSAVLHQHPSGLAPLRRYKKASLHRKNRSLNALYSQNLIEENIRHQKQQLQWLEIILVSVFSFPSCYYYWEDCKRMCQATSELSTRDAASSFPRRSPSSPGAPERAGKPAEKVLQGLKKGLWRNINIKNSESDDNHDIKYENLLRKYSINLLTKIICGKIYVKIYGKIFDINTLSKIGEFRQPSVKFVPGYLANVDQY